MPETFEELNNDIKKLEEIMTKLLAGVFTPQELANVYVLGDVNKIFIDAYIMAQAKREA